MKKLGRAEGEKTTTRYNDVMDSAAKHNDRYKAFIKRFFDDYDCWFKLSDAEKHLELVTDDETSMIRVYNKLKPGERERDELGTFYWWVSR